MTPELHPGHLGVFSRELLQGFRVEQTILVDGFQELLLVEVNCLPLILTLCNHSVSLRPNLFVELAVGSFQNELGHREILTLKRCRKNCLNDRILKLRVEPNYL